jgi:hypothetical protein
MADTFTAITQQLMAALEDEIDAVKKEFGTEPLVLRHGRRHGRLGTSYLYAFLLDSEIALPCDTPGQLRVGELKYQTVVVGMQGLEIILSLKEDLGPLVPGGTLLVSPYYLLEILRSRLADTVFGSLHANKNLAVRLFRLEGDSCDAGLPHAHIDHLDGLNEGQRRAILNCQASHVCFIWGPPGTGKTRTIGKLAALLQGRERVLVTSHTNVAVDAAVLAVLQYLPETEREPGTVIRVGEPQRSDPSVAGITLEAVIEDKARSLREEKAVLEAERKRVSRQIARLESSARYIEEAQRREPEVQRLRTTLVQLEARARGLKEAEIEALTKRDRLCERLKRARERGLPKGFFAPVIRLEQQADSADRLVRELSERRLNLEMESHDTLETLRQAEEIQRLKMALAKRRGGTDPLNMRREINRLRASLEELASSITRIELDLEALPRTILAGARVVGATLYRLAIMPELHETPFDTIIIDEASMAPLPNVWFAAGCSARRVVVSGDFRQLPPIAAASDPGDYPMGSKWMTRDIFEQAGLVDASGKVVHDPRLSILTEQHRMHPAIGNLANRLAYKDSNLEHKAKPHEYMAATRSYPKPDHALVFCDTSMAGCWCARSEPGYSRYNLYSALVSILLAREITVNGSGEVGVITPYRAQARLLHALAEEYGLDSSQVEIATVHRFQGAEKHFIIFDIVDDFPYRIGRLLKGGFGSNAMRLLNVACTRAKGKLVIVGDRAHLEARTGKDDSLRTLLDYPDPYRFLDSREVIKANSGSTTGADPLGPHGILVCDSTAFHALLAEDMRRARSQVILYSPYIREKRFREMLEGFQCLCEKGARVMIVTREPSPADGKTRQLLSEASSIEGLSIVCRSNLHQRMAFIDRDVAYFGNLSPLSHGYSAEQMIRLSSPPIVRRLVELTGAALLREQKNSKAKHAFLVYLCQYLSESHPTPTCLDCGRPMRLIWGKYGPFFGCPSHASERHRTVSIPRSVVVKFLKDMDLRCPDCGGRICLKSSRYGTFLACSEWPDCRWRETS